MGEETDKDFIKRMAYRTGIAREWVYTTLSMETDWYKMNWYTQPKDWEVIVKQFISFGWITKRASKWFLDEYYNIHEKYSEHENERLFYSEIEDFEQEVFDKLVEKVKEQIIRDGWDWEGKAWFEEFYYSY